MGIVLPKEALDVLKVDEGSTLYLSSEGEGVLRMTSVDPDFQKEMEIAERCMTKYENALRELAK